MAPMFGYLVEVLLCSGLFALLYRSLLVRKVNFSRCRRYLVGTVLLSAVIPALELPLYPAETPYATPLIVETLLTAPTATVLAAPPSEAIGQSAWQSWLAGCYFAVSGGLILLLGARLYSIFRLRKRAQLTHYEEYSLAESEAVRTPFSFGRTIFLGRDYVPNERLLIITHERAHIRYHHTIERLILELMRTLFWINPFLWLAERWLIDVQEWEADAAVLADGAEIRTYQTTIFKQLFGYNPDITCGLSNSFTKNRFLMMTQQPRGRNPLLRLGAALPLVAGMIMAFGATAAEPKIEVKRIATEQSEQGTTARLEVLPEHYRFNGEEITKEELPTAIEAFRKGLSDPQQAVIHISAAPETKLGAIQDAKELIRQSKVLRIRYEEMGIGAQMLPPRRKAEIDPAKSIETSYTKVNRRNLFQINLNANGKLLCGTYAKLELAEGLDGMCGYLKRFVMNPTGVLELSEQQDRLFTLSDGRQFTLPVSKGMITINTVPNAAAKDYFALTHAISVAYGEMRNELAQKLFQRPMLQLSKEEQELIHRAIPIRVSEGMVKVKEF